MTDIEFEVQHLVKSFKDKKKVIHAVDDVSLYIYRAETFGIVGESGCGKTTLGKTMIGILNKDHGEVRYRGKNVHKKDAKFQFEFTKNVQMIFQDPYSSLDPSKKVLDIVGEGLEIHKMVHSKEEKEQKVMDLLKLVGLNKEHAMRKPYEFSGGQRQRIGIARALAVEPEFLFCDEPISALDVSIQAQIINLLKELKKTRQLTMLFIAHDVAMVKYISDRIGVMYLGKLVEVCESERLYVNPLHPYTETLMEAIPIADPIIAKQREITTLSGEAFADPSICGCKFYPRCKKRKEICKQECPVLKEVEKGHWVACHQ